MFTIKYRIIDGTVQELKYISLDEFIRIFDGDIEGQIELNFNGKKTNKLNLIKGNKDCEYIRTGQNRPQDYGDFAARCENTNKRHCQRSVFDISGRIDPNQPAGRRRVYRGISCGDQPEKAGLPHQGVHQPGSAAGG